MYFFLLLSQRFDFKNTVISKSMNKQTAVTLSIKNKGPTFLFTDTEFKLKYPCLLV